MAIFSKYLENTKAVINGNYDIPDKLIYFFEEKKYINKMKKEIYLKELENENSS